MALSGNVVTSAKEGRSVTLEWTATQSIEKNTSTISWKLVGSGSAGGYVAVFGIKVNINGSQVFYRDSNTRTNCYVGTVLCSGTTTVPHNADGTKTFSISVDAAIYTTAFGSTGSGSFTLNTIPRASTPSVSATSVNFGDSITITITRASSSFTHTLEYKFGNASGTIGTGIATSKSWTVPEALMNTIPNSTSGTITITCKTYSGSTLVGSKNATFTAKVPSSVVPTISTVATSDPTGCLATYGGYVQQHSKVKADVTAAGAYQSTIKSYSIVMNGTTYTSNGSTSGFLKTSGTNTIKATVTDSRGRTATKSVTISVMAYANPSISSFSVIRCNADGTANEDGAYMKATFKAAITALNNYNSKNVVLKYKDSTSSTWIDAGTYSSYSVNTSKIISADVDHSYNLILTATDDFGTATNTKDLGTAFTLMDFNASGKGIAIGKVSEADKFEVNMESEIKNTLVLSKTTDASGTADNKPALIVGGTSDQAHIEMDANEILAKSNGSTPVGLNLNTDGGNVYVGRSGGTGKFMFNGEDIFTPSTETVTSTDFVQTSFTIQKYGKVRVLHLANQLKAGTYANTHDLITLPEEAISAVHAYCSLGGGFVLTITGNHVRCNTNTTIASNTYLIGEIVYIVK